MARNIPHVRETLGSSEENDCFVIAFAVAFDVSYRFSHALCASKGRKTGKGTEAYTRFSILRSEISNGNAKEIKDYDLTHGYDPENPRGFRRVTLDQFVTSHPRGRFLLGISGHAISVIDGVVYDPLRKTSLKARVWEGWEITI